MGVALLFLRQLGLQSNLADHELQLLQVSSKLRKLTGFIASISSGRVTPATIANAGSDMFGEVLDFMDASDGHARAFANEQTALSARAFDILGQENYYNSSYAASAGLYRDKNGRLNTDKIYEKFYEQALKEYAEKVYTPLLKEQEEQLQQEKAKLETLIQQEKAEEQSVKQAKEEAAKNDAPKFA